MLVNCSDHLISTMDELEALYGEPHHINATYRALIEAAAIFGSKAIHRLIEAIELRELCECGQPAGLTVAVCRQPSISSTARRCRPRRP
jgi:hypothetical protein